MASFKTYKFADLGALELHLNGGAFSGANPKRGYVNLVGKTLTFGVPAKAVLFTAGANPFDLTFTEMKTQVEAQSAGLVTVLAMDERVCFIETTPTTGLTITGGTSLGIFALPATGVVGRVYNYFDGAIPVVAPCYISVYPMGNYHVLIVKE
jgi:hypothetical protein